MTLDDARTIARSWNASAGQYHEAAQTLLVEFERAELQLGRVLRVLTAELDRADAR